MTESNSNSKTSYDSDTVESSSNFTNESRTRSNLHSNQNTKTTPNQTRDEKRVYLTDKTCQQFQTLEKLIWNSNQFIEKTNKNQCLNEIILKILL